jgi:hypothetical protein
MKEAPVTPLAPFEVSIATAKIAICCEIERSVFVAWATKRAASVM